MGNPIPTLGKIIPTKSMKGNRERGASSQNLWRAFEDDAAPCVMMMNPPGAQPMALTNLGQHQLVKA